MDGVMLQLGDGNEWLAPRLSMWGSSGGFTPAYSMVVDLDEKGNWISGGASPESQHMKELFDRLYPWMEDPSGVEAGQALDAACELLGINYVVSKVELAMLKVLKTDDTLIRILSTALDWETVIEWSKKKMQEASPEVSAG